MHNTQGLAVSCTSTTSPEGPADTLQSNYVASVAILQSTERLLMAGVRRCRRHAKQVGDGAFVASVASVSTALCQTVAGSEVGRCRDTSMPSK